MSAKLTSINLYIHVHESRGLNDYISMAINFYIELFF